MTNKAKVVAYVIKHNESYMKTIQKGNFGIVSILIVSNITGAYIYKDLERAKKRC